MAFEVTMPKLTDSMEEGRIVEWKVAAGDRVREGDVLAEIETDKAVMELESFRSGAVAELVRQDGEVVPVGDVIARIAEGGEAAAVPRTEAPAPPEEAVAGPAAEAPPDLPEDRGPERAPQAAPGPGESRTTEPESTESKSSGAGEEVPLPGAHPLAERGDKHSPRPLPPSPAETSGRSGASPGVKASPRARRLAKEKGVELAGLRGTGPDGRITTADVEAAVPGPVSRGGGLPGDRADEELPAVAFAEGEAEVEEVSFYQKATIRRVVASKHVIPHFYLNQTIRAEGLLARRTAEKEASGATLTHLMLRACALALGKFPEANRSYDRGRWIRWKVTNLGLAIQTEAGLAVGVLRDAGGEDLAGLVRRGRELIERARAGKLRPVERANSTFTLSNLGGFAVESFSAIINPPSAMTLAVGSVVQAPVVEDGRLAVGQVLHLTLSCDHRVVDGVLAARFLGEVRRLLESPEEL